jgi:hypothetical protein
MPSIKGKLVNKLAIVKIRIRQLQKDEPKLVKQELPAAIDTGGSDCFTRVGILAKLGFSSNGSHSMAGVSYLCFDVEIGVSDTQNNLKWFPVKMMEIPDFPFSGQGCELAIGNSFLQNCRFIYDGPNAEFTLEW